MAQVSELAWSVRHVVPWDPFTVVVDPRCSHLTLTILCMSRAQLGLSICPVNMLVEICAELTGSCKDGESHAKSGVSVQVNNGSSIWAKLQL